MTLSDSATAQLLETFRSGGGGELIRDAVRLVLQELIKAETTEAVGAGRHERSESRVTERNGHRPRLLATQAGDVELKIPNLRKGSFMPSAPEPRQCIDRALHAVIMEAYVAGVSTRSVDELVAALGAESGVSKSEVSRICAGLDEMVEAFRGRSLGHVEFPYVYLDATYLKVHNSVGQPAFPEAHWQKIWSTNPIERINKEIKRRSRVVGILLTRPPPSALLEPSSQTSTTNGRPPTAPRDRVLSGHPGR